MSITRDISRRGPQADPLFRLLWAGEALASLSEQLFIVCLTLLVLDVAGPGAILGLVLAVAAVPRAVLLLFGGVLADRVAPARIVAEHCRLPVSVRRRGADSVRPPAVPPPPRRFDDHRRLDIREESDVGAAGAARGSSLRLD